MKSLTTWFPKLAGVSKGGMFPLGTLLLERSRKSPVCYTFCPGWRGKGTARPGANTFPHQESRRGDGAAAIISPPDFGRGKRYIQPVPRPPSRRSDINAAACAASRCPAPISSSPMAAKIWFWTAIPAARVSLKYWAIITVNTANQGCSSIRLTTSLLTFPV